MDTLFFKCKQCGWSGTENELDSDTFECCMGPTPIDICPNCGSLDIITISTDEYFATD